MKSSFWRRLSAYIIDIILINLLVSTICSVLPDKELVSETELNSLQKQLINNEISPNQYIESYKNILYDNSKHNKIEVSINLILTIGYFVIFQYMNKGQTLGKMLLKIRVVDKDTNKPPTIIKGLLRTIIIHNIVSGFIGAVLINVLSKGTYMSIYFATIELESFLYMICLLLVALKGQGVHDLITHTQVIEER